MNQTKKESLAAITLALVVLALLASTFSLERRMAKLEQIELDTISALTQHIVNHKKMDKTDKPVPRGE